MLTPVDYPVTEENTQPGATVEITYAELLERYACQQVITEEMIHLACLKIEAAQDSPFALNSPLPRRTAIKESANYPAERIVTRWLNFIRQAFLPRLAE